MLLGTEKCLEGRGTELKWTDGEDDGMDIRFFL